MNALNKTDFEEICRACLARFTEFRPTSIIQPEMFIVFLKTELIIDEKELPNNVCVSCYQKLDEINRFKDACIASNKKLINILKKPGVKDENVLDKVQVKEEKILTDDIDWDNEDIRDVSDVENIKEEKSYNCEDCSESFSDEGTLKKHSRGHKYSCEYCNVSYIGLSSLVIHIKKKHKITPLSCEKCPKKFVLKRQLDLHNLRVHKTSYKCPTCCKIFAKAHLLTKHQKHHATERLHHCLKCYKSFKTYQTLRLHEKRIHRDPKTPVSCTICGVMVLNITAHLQTHNPTKTFKCPDCVKTFRDKYCLERHRERRHDDPKNKKRPYLCCICGMGSTSTTALKTHMQHIHSNEKRYNCRVCKKSFKSEHSVASHVRFTHENERRYGCNQCSKKFQTSTILNIHMRIHTGERPFECRVCGKTFRQPSTLKTHMKLHGFEP